MAEHVVVFVKPFLGNTLPRSKPSRNISHPREYLNLELVSRDIQSESQAMMAHQMGSRNGSLRPSFAEIVDLADASIAFIGKLRD